MNYDNELRERLCTMMAKTGQTMCSMAPKMGIGRSTLSNFLKSRRKTYPYILGKIADFVSQYEKES